MDHDDGDPDLLRASPGEATPEVAAGPRASLERREDLSEPPVVARLVVEIRSDGQTTIARGALEDVATENRVAVEARGTTPISLALGLARSMFSAPSLARGVARALLPRRIRRNK